MRLIDADALIQDLKDHKIPFNADINEAIIVAPTIDAVPVKHGHWVEQEHEDWKWSKEYRCSECGKYRLVTNPFGREWNYCPNCGAYMGVEE